MNIESPSSEIGANLKQLIRESKYRTQEEFAFDFEEIVLRLRYVKTNEEFAKIASKLVKKRYQHFKIAN